VPPPEQLEFSHVLRQEWMDAQPGLPECARAALQRELAIEFKPVKPWNPLAPDVREPAQHIWLRAGGRLPDDPLLHTCVLAYASDFNLLSTALLPHGRSWFSRQMIVASIDHALWFHRQVRVDDWLLCSMDAPTSGGARGFSRGTIFDRAGRLVCSVTQESLMRQVPE
jgi:acyl-CoA thioesterase II